MERDMRSGRFVAWANAVLGGHVSPDTAAERICGRDRRHRVACPDGGLGPGGSARDASLPLVLAGLRAGGVRGLLLVLPTPGDPLGLPGPPEFNETATAAGEAVLTVGTAPRGLVPEVIAESPDGPGGVQVVWHVHRVTPWVALDVPSLAEAERELTETLRQATEALAGLDVAQWRPEAAGRLSAIRAHAGAEGLAPGYPARAHRVLALAQRLFAITELAGCDTGAAVTAREMEARAAELRPLARAARRAQVAAFNAALERDVDVAPGPAAAVELDTRRF